MNRNTATDDKEENYIYNCYHELVALNKGFVFWMQMTTYT